MNSSLISFRAKDNIITNGIIYKNNIKTNKVLIQVHGMTSNCFKTRNKIIAETVASIGIDTINFNNRGSEIIKYISDDKGKRLAGTAYEEIVECYDDIVGAIEYAKSLGYEEIYIQGHSLGATKVVYTYNQLLKENSNLLEYIKGIILLSLVDIPGIINHGTNSDYIKLAKEKEKNNELMEMMPMGGFIHPISVKNYLRYIQYNKDIDFAKYDEDSYDFAELNNIKCPLFMRWGNINELIKQNAEELSNFINSKINNKLKDINYINGADHGYKDKEQLLANEISDFLKRIVK